MAVVNIQDVVVHKARMRMNMVVVCFVLNHKLEVRIIVSTPEGKGKNAKIATPR